VTRGSQAFNLVKLAFLSFLAFQVAYGCTCWDRAAGGFFANDVLEGALVTFGALRIAHRLVRLLVFGLTSHQECENN